MDEKDEMDKRRRYAFKVVKENIYEDNERAVI